MKIMETRHVRQASLLVFAICQQVLCSSLQVDDAERSATRLPVKVSWRKGKTAVSISNRFLQVHLIQSEHSRSIFLPQPFPLLFCLPCL
jgi:hypothetical protein